MPDELEILDVQKSLPRTTEFSGLEGVSQQKWVDLAVTIRNGSARKTRHVMSSLSTLNYDPATRTLFLGLSEPERTAGRFLFHKFSPGTKAVLPGEVITIRVAVPLEIKRILPPAGLKFQCEVLDISDMEQVQLTIAYGETAFRPVPSDKPEQRTKRLRAWGQTIVKTVAVSKS